MIFDRYNFKQQIEYAHSSEGNNVRITYRGDESDKYIFIKEKGLMNLFRLVRNRLEIRIF